MNTKDFLRNDAIDGKAKVCNKQLDYLALRLSEMPIYRRYLFFSSSSSPSSSLFFSIQITNSWQILLKSIPLLSESYFPPINESSKIIRIIRIVEMH